jgi:hypothetical protein
MNSGLVAASQPAAEAVVGVVTDNVGAVGAADVEADSAGEVAGAGADAAGEPLFVLGPGSTPTGATHPVTTTITRIKTAAALIG